MKIVNRTPHAITIVNPRPASRRAEVAYVELPAPAAKDVARVVASETRVGETCVDGLCVAIVDQQWGSITGLPAPRRGVFHIVSRVVAAAACCSPRGGGDLLVPSGLTRGEDGRVNGCTSLARASTSLPGLEDVR